MWKKLNHERCMKQEKDAMEERKKDKEDCLKVELHQMLVSKSQGKS